MTAVVLIICTFDRVQSRPPPPPKKRLHVTYLSISSATIYGIRDVISAFPRSIALSLSTVLLKPKSSVTWLSPRAQVAIASVSMIAEQS